MFDQIDWERLLPWAKKHWKVLGLAALGFVILLALLLMIRQPKDAQSAQPAPVTAGGKEQNTTGKSGKKGPEGASQTSKSAIKVDLKGAVKKPGLYTLANGSVLADLLEKSGGLTKEADANRFNLAQPLEEGMVVYIPKEGEAVPDFHNVGAVPGTKTTGTGAGQQGRNSADKVHLNTASQQELESLSGVGPKKAEQIIAYREEHPFQKVDELKDIPGIGPKRFEQLKDNVLL
ncbi:helix-hairpin-helix domain-containing protein [Fructobacillus papyrifericola]|uniref:Competence protein ComEA n=1 Tax=Fructobacillus papyrifericola TaxID=2713172 RepID=A0ABS5QRK6_9LACO|nr:helix-hairpin-helix domain-containing protein [Fructobacillus papyrifericola]MBS9335760.1 competence protein ComEA [Fructobacillus papyrifericola]